jgi:uridine kinase
VTSNWCKSGAVIISRVYDFGITAALSYLIHLTAMCYQISGIARGQRQIMHQMDNLNNLLRGSLGEKSQQTRTNKKNITTDSNSIAATVIVVVAVGCLGIFLMKGLLTRK